MRLSVDFFGICDILFFVMRDTFDNLSCEEGQADAIEAQEQERAERKRKASMEMTWFIRKRRQQGDWS